MLALSRFFDFSIRCIEIFIRALTLLFKQDYRDKDGLLCELTNPIRLRLFCEQTGGAFIKFGQILSLRNDILSPSYTEELLKLLSNVPEIPFAEIEQVFIEEFYKPPELYFKTFNPVPIGSASLAQVYYATLDTGEPVAVKIKRPNINKVFERDFLVISFVVDILGVWNIARALRLKEVALEFIAWTERELDFRHEAINAETLFQHASKHPDTVVPKIYADMSSSKILVSEYFGGDALQVSFILAELAKNPYFEKTFCEHQNISLEKMANYLITDMMRQVFIDGFFHADPHPSNLYFLKNNKLAYIDFGIVGEASLRRLYLLRLVYGIAINDLRLAAQGFIEYAHQMLEEDISLFKREKNNVKQKHKKALEKIEEIIMESFERDLRDIVTPWYDALNNKDDKKGSLQKEKNVWERKSSTAVFTKLVLAIRKYGFYVPQEIILFFRALAIVDMVALHLNQNFNLISAMNLFFEKNPLSRIEEIIEKESHKKELAGSIEPTQQESFEELIELQTIEKEKLSIAKERLGEVIAYYAERDEDIRKILK